MKMYHFVTHWFFEAPIGRVWSELEDLEASRWTGVRKTRAWQDLVHPVQRAHAG